MTTTHTISIRTTVPLAEVIAVVDDNLKPHEFVCGAKDMKTYYWLEVYTQNPLDWVADLIPNTGTSYGSTPHTPTTPV